MCSSNLRLAKPTDMTTVKDGGFYRKIKKKQAAVWPPVFFIILFGQTTNQ